MSEQSVKALPLQDKRVLVTRTREQASVLSQRLSALGAEAVEFPTIRIVAPRSWLPLDEALARLCAEEDGRDPYYSWLIFTSANGVNVCFERLRERGYRLDGMRQVRVAAIGPATAAALADYGIHADLVPDEYIAERVAATLIADARERGAPLAGMRVLLARAAEARKVLVTDLQEAGAMVDEVAAYRTLSATSDDERGREVLSLLRERQLDVLTFTSSSTVRHFMQWLADCGYDPSNQEMSSLLCNERVKIACIGPITSQTAREAGLVVQIEASTFTIDGLVEAIVQYY